eukprot:gene7774-634_t
MESQNTSLIPVTDQSIKTVSPLTDNEKQPPSSKKAKNVTLGKLTLFVASLAGNSIVFDATEQLVNAGIAKGHHVKQTLAAFGLAVFIVRWLCSVFASFEPVGLVLVDSIHARKIVLGLLHRISLGIAVVVFSLVTTPIGTLFLDTVHRASPELSNSTKQFLFWLILWPYFDGLHRLHRGILLKHGQHIGLVWSASIGNAVAQILAVTMCLGLFQPVNPHVLPLFAAYGGIITEVSMLLLNLAGEGSRCSDG